MKVKCKDITDFIEKSAPLDLAEEWDNVGLILGDYNHDISRIMVCVDVTSNVVSEAQSKNVNLILSHHPLIFKGLKRLNEQDFKGKIIYNLIKSNIDVYSAHTNLDVAQDGINNQLAKLIGLKDIRNLNKYKKEKLFKLVVFVPEKDAEKVRTAINSAGAGWIGNYSDCSFMTKGIGTFKPTAGTNPYIGSAYTFEKVDEYRIETIVPEKLLNDVVSAMLNTHPYEEPAYDIYPTELTGKEYGLGKVGYVETPQTLNDFVMQLKKKLSVDTVRIIGSTNRLVKKIGVFCGSFDENFSNILKHNIDVLVTGDIKYHTAVDMKEMGLCVIDAGHFNTEKIFKPVMVELLKINFPGIDVFASTVESDPFIFS